MASIPYPNVPIAPGVPALPRSPAFPPILAGLLGAAQGALWEALQVDDRWGVFDASGLPMLDVNGRQGLIVSVNSADMRGESRVADFPVERGSFVSYNKVEFPDLVDVSLCVTGSETDRTYVLGEIEKARQGVTLWQIVMPEVRFADCTLERYDFSRRASRGATMLTVNLCFKKIRQVQSSRGAVAVKDPQSAPVVDAGKVQAAPPATSTKKSLALKLKERYL